MSAEKMSDLQASTDEVPDRKKGIAIAVLTTLGLAVCLSGYVSNCVAIKREEVYSRAVSSLETIESFGCPFHVVDINRGKDGQDPFSPCPEIDELNDNLNAAIWCSMAGLLAIPYFAFGRSWLSVRRLLIFVTVAAAIIAASMWHIERDFAFTSWLFSPIKPAPKSMLILVISTIYFAHATWDAWATAWFRSQTEDGPLSLR